MKRVTLAEVPPQPWRNGGGLTRELLAWPADGPWLARISVADITRNGDFSVYPGVERWFAVIEGTGVELDFEVGSLLLTNCSDPFRFDGEQTPACRLLAGPTRDLNLMAQRACGSSQMQRVQPGLAWHSGAELRAVFTTGPMTLRVGARPETRLAAGTLAWDDGGDAAPWRALLPIGAPPAWWLSLQFRAP
jgi:uncharacterized protein